MKYFHWIVGVGLCVSSLMASASNHTQSHLSIEEPYARATAGGQSVGAAYFRIVNQGQTEDKLLSVTADISASVELHTMMIEGDVAKMREVREIIVPPGQSVDLKPGGLHVMFLGLKAPLKEGNRFPATLTFEKAGEIKVDFQVRPVRAHLHHRH